MSLAGLATNIAMQEQDTSIGDPQKDDHKRIQIQLHHVHLPKLEDAGLVEYDTDRRTVTLCISPQFLRLTKSESR